jgi:hypothetical protein
MAANAQDVKPAHKVLFEIMDVPGRTKPVWNEVGVGFVNSDGSINIRLHRKLKPGRDYQLREQSTREPDGGKAKVYNLNRSKKGK